MKYRTLSSNSDPGRAGFTYAIELRIVGSDRYDRFQRMRQFENSLKQQLGRPYQRNWIRKQLNRRWYIYSLDHGQTVRFCFRSAQDQLLAGMLYQ